MGHFSRVVASFSIAAVLGGCVITSKQRTVATYATVGVALIGVAVYLQAGLSTCPPDPNDLDECEEDRHDQKNTGGVIAIGGVVAAIIAQLWPVSDERDEQPMVAKVVAPPPPPPESASTLRDPAAVALATNARNFAAAGKCVEAFGSLTALRKMDRELADQLAAWDPMVTRCRKSSADNSASAIEVTPGGGPPSSTPPVARDPLPLPPAGPGQPPTPTP